MEGKLRKEGRGKREVRESSPPKALHDHPAQTHDIELPTTAPFQLLPFVSRKTPRTSQERASVKNDSDRDTMITKRNDHQDRSYHNTHPHDQITTDDSF